MSPSELEVVTCGPPSPTPMEDYDDSATLPDNVSEITTNSVSLSTLDDDIACISSEAQLERYLGDNLDPAHLVPPSLTATSRSLMVCTPKPARRG